jgi:FKBP-type peptidyl-prolyl cis-trans isomerase
MKHWLMHAGLLIVTLSVAACSGGAAVPSTTAQGGNLITTPSGLKYEDIVVGTGVSPAPADMVTVHYTGTLQDGTVFDASRMHGGPASFPLNQVIKGWTEGVGSMKVGGTRKLVIPPELGYGSQAQGPIPANSTLTFIVELLDIPKVKIEDTQVGTGAAAVPGKSLSVYYTGKLENGKVFDSNVGKTPMTFTLGAGQMIPGFEQGITGMKAGGKRVITIPSSLGYGVQGAGDAIPPNSNLIFELELVDVK